MLTGNSQTTPIFEAKFEWDKDQTKFYNSLITTSGIVGNFVGALVGGRAISIGRRKAALYWQCLAIVGAGVTMIPHPLMFCLGRFLAGITAGIAGNVMGKSIDETIPAEVMS